MKCLSLHSVDIAQDHRWLKSLSFLGPKIWSKIGTNIKNARTSSFFMHAIKKSILLICKTNSSSYERYYHLILS